jgi:hypothetical protein
MTFIEKAVELNPDLNKRDTVDNMCPEELGLEMFSKCDGLTCEQCWNREIN